LLSSDYKIDKAWKRYVGVQEDDLSSNALCEWFELPIYATVITLEEDLKGSREVPSLVCTANGGSNDNKI